MGRIYSPILLCQSVLPTGPHPPLWAVVYVLDLKIPPTPPTTLLEGTFQMNCVPPPSSYPDSTPHPSPTASLAYVLHCYSPLLSCQPSPGLPDPTHFSDDKTAFCFTQPSVKVMKGCVSPLQATLPIKIFCDTPSPYPRVLIGLYHRVI